MIKNLRGDVKQFSYLKSLHGELWGNCFVFSVQPPPAFLSWVSSVPVILLPFSLFWDLLFSLKRSSWICEMECLLSLYLTQTSGHVPWSLFTTKRSSEAWHQVKTDFLLTNSADFEINPFMPNTHLHLYVFWCLFDEPVDGAMCTLGLAWKQTFRKHVQPTWYFCQWEEARESWREELDSSNLHSNACVQRRCAEVT